MTEEEEFIGSLKALLNRYNITVSIPEIERLCWIDVRDVVFESNPESQFVGKDDICIGLRELLEVLKK